MKNIFQVAVLHVFLLAMAASLQGETEDLGEGVFLTRNAKEETGQKIAIVTVIISGENQESNENYQNITYGETVSLGTKSKELYAKRHGYDFIIATKKLDSCYGITAVRPLECAWTKLAVISRVLENYDWVFWTDADSVILNFDTELESFLDENYDIIACTYKPMLGKRSLAEFPVPLNTGEVFYKNSDFSKYVIQNAWKNHEKKTPGSFEQARINGILLSLPREQKNAVLVYPARSFNLPLEGYRDGSFLIHLLAYHGKILYEKFKEIETKYGWIIDNEERRQNAE